MGLLTRSLGVKNLSLEDPNTPLLPPGALMESLGMGRSDAGVMVNEHSAMRITTAQSCVRIISEDLGTNAHEIFQQMPDGSMRLATNHRLWPIIHDEPNPYMSAAVFWSALVASAVGWGNGYAFIKRDNASRVVSMSPLASGKTSMVKTRAGELLYATTQTDTGAVAYIDPANILHVPGLSFDGFTGLSPIGTCKNAFGLALAAEKYGAQFFGNGARATGVLTYPGVLEPEAYENLKKSIREKMNGDNALAPLLLEEGLKWEQTSIAPNEAQFIATRTFQRSEIAALYRVAMHLLQDLTRSTNNNIEHQSLDHVKHCLRPWAVRVEQETNRKLLGGPFTMEHNFKDMMRGDFASQAAGIQTLRNIGYYSNNDIARELRQNPIPAAQGGDIRMVQGAMIPLTALLGADKPSDDVATPDGGGSDATNPFDRGALIRANYRQLFADATSYATGASDKAASARRAFQPVVSSMAQSMLAMRFGNVTMTKRELELIEGQTNAIADSAPAWARNDAAAIATRIAEQVYGALAGEILN